MKKDEEINITISIKVKDLAEFLISKFPQRIAIDEELVTHIPKVKQSREFTDLHHKYFKMKINKGGTQTFFYKPMDKRINLGTSSKDNLYTIKKRYYQEIGYYPRTTLESFIKLEIRSDFYHLKKNNS